MQAIPRGGGGGRIVYNHYRCIYIYMEGRRNIAANLFAETALFVREPTAGGAGSDAALREGVGTGGPQRDAADHPAGTGAGRRSDAGKARGNAGDGQHQFDADAGSDAEKRE